MGSGWAVRVWGYFFILPNRVGFAKLQPVDHPIRWPDQASRLICFGGGYGRVYRVYKTTKSFQTYTITNKNKIVKNLISKLNHKHSKPKHKHKPIFFLDPVRSHQIRQPKYKKSPNPVRSATIVEENNQIRWACLKPWRHTFVLNRGVAFVFQPRGLLGPSFFL